MALSTGDRGAEVTDLQKALKAAGYDPGPIDGVYGAKTAAAVRAYQQANNLTVDGKAGDETLGSLAGTSPATGGESSNTALGVTVKDDYTDDTTTRFNGLPGHPEVWINNDTGEVYITYMAEGTEPPVPLMFHVPSEEVLKTYFGEDPFGYDRNFSSGELAKTGAVPFGDVANLEDTTGDPWAGFTAKMERAKKVMPWLEDEQVFAIVAGAYLEGRAVEDWELVDTEWYQTHNEAERAWMTKAVQDPATAAQQLQDDIRAVYELFAAMGIEDPDIGAVEYIARKWTEGTWSNQYRDDQIRILTGTGYEGLTIDAGLGSYLAENQVEIADATVGRDRVQELYRTWLGPMFTPEEGAIDRWAAEYRDDAVAAEAKLVESLRSQRLSLFPEYEDPTLTYNDIAGPWKSMAYNTWGIPADDMDAQFQDIVRMNDATEAQKELRKIGAERGYERVTTDMMNDLEAGMRRNVRGAV